MMSKNYATTSKGMWICKKLWKVRQDVKTYVINPICDNVKKYIKKWVITSKRSQKLSHDVKSTSWHQKVHHGVQSMSWSQKYAMLSKVRTSWCMQWRQKIRHNAKKCVLTSKLRHYVNKYVITSKNTSSHQNVRYIHQIYIITLKVCCDVKKVCIGIQMFLWRQNFAITLKTFSPI